jgi:hypothetical protein
MVPMSPICCCEALDHGSFRLGLRFGGRIGKFRIDRLSNSGGVFRIVHAHLIPADLSLAALSRFVEVIIAEKKLLVSAAFFVAS